MRKQRGGDNSEVPSPRKAQSRLVQSTGRSSKSGTAVLVQNKLLPPAPPRSISGINGGGGGGATAGSRFCISSSSMGVRRLPANRVYIIGKGRFGKRPPTLTADCIGGPAIDSEDSGFGCDFQSSESQLSWSNEDVKLGAGGGGVTNSVQQPIFSLSARTLSNSNLSTSSNSQISISTTSSSSTSPASTTSSFTAPQFSTSSPEKQFLTSLLHESLAQEDAVDPFDGLFYTTAGTTPPQTVPSSTHTNGALSLSDSGISSFPSSVSSLGALSPDNNTGVQQQPQQQTTNVLLILPGTGNGVGQQQPLTFAQVFGKLSNTANSSPAATSALVSNAIVNELLQRKAAEIAKQGQEQQQQQLHHQQLTCGDRSVIKIDPEMTGSIKLPTALSNEAGENKISNFQITFQPLNSSSGGAGQEMLAPTQATQLKDILMESPAEEAMELGESPLSESSNHGGSVITINAPVPTQEANGGNSLASDPMIILSQAVNFQKELFEEPALDGIPLTGKSGTNISGFGFNKGSIIPATTATATTATLKNLVVESSHNQLSGPQQQPLVTVVQGQTVLESPQSMKLLQLTEGVRMSPDSSDRVTVTNGLPFQVGTQLPTTPSTPRMGVTTTLTHTSTTQSPIPMKRTRFSFPHPASKGTGLKLRNQNHNQNYMPARSVGKRLPPGTTPTLTSNLSPYARDGRSQLQIISQPEEQHRARYQTEGSRGAIKDRKGNGFPTVKLAGYDKPATLQIFIGTDQGKVSPHMFYQACKVTGKSSTPCIEKKVEGTILIEIEFEPGKDMVISCDCVGILKERNVDVEQRFPFHHASQSRKKLTKCRMIFRTTIMNPDGMEETLQVASLPILCTQPPGVPEICKQSLMECPAKGGLELFVIGKNFLKDTRVIFQEEDQDGRVLWEANSEPLKDYLQQNHLICAVPPYKEEKLVEPVDIKVLVVSGGKHSEPHRFMYLPDIGNAHLGGVPSAISSCLPNSPPQQHSPPMMPASLVQQIPNGQGLMPMDIQTVTVNTVMPARENGLVKSVIAPSPEACSPVSVVSMTSPDGSLCGSSSGGQPSPPATTTSLSTLTNIGFSTPATLIQSTVTAGENSPVVNTFLQAAQQQQQQVEVKPVVSLMKAANELLESMKSNPAPASQFSGLTTTLQPEKPVVTSAIPLDLQFPTQDLPTTEAPATITTVNSAFQTVASEQPMSCVNLPQMINGIGMAVTTAPPAVITTTVPISNPQQQLSSTTTTANDVVMATRNAPAPVVTVNSTVPVTALSVADCLGQAIIKTEPTPIPLNPTVVPPTTQQPTVPGQVPPPGTVMGLLGGADLQGHQGSLANALSQMTDNELINYINPNCFEGTLL